MDINKRAKIFMEEVENTRVSTVFAANTIIKELVETLEKTEAELSELAQQVCDVCSPDNYGWVFNAVEGRGVCTCILTAEPYQILEKENTELKKQVLELEKRYSELLVVNSKYAAIKAELEEQGVHLLSKDCWCEPMVETP